MKIAGYPTDGDDVVGAVGPRLAVGPVTGVVVTWSWGSDNRPLPYRVQAAMLPPGGHWKTPFAVTPANWSHRPSVAVAGDGTTYVTFIGNADDDTRWPLKVRQRSPHGAWSTAKALAPTSTSSRVEVAANRAGDVVVGFVDGFDHLSVVYKRRDTGWQRPSGWRRASRSGASRWPSRPAPSSRLYEQSGGGILRAPDAERHLVVAAGAGLRDGPRGPPRHRPARRHPGLLGHMALYASYFAHGGAWTPRDTVSPYLDVLEGFHIAIAPDGDAAVLWDQEGAQLKVRLMAS